jgi:hypothetical protein
VDGLRALQNQSGIFLTTIRHLEKGTDKVTCELCCGSKDIFSQAETIPMFVGCPFSMEIWAISGRVSAGLAESAKDRPLIAICDVEDVSPQISHRTKDF